MIALNHSRELIEAKLKCNQGSVSRELAEAMGVREALSRVKSSAWRDVEIETECMLIVQAIRSNDVCLSYLGIIVDECKQILYEFVDQKVSFEIC